MVADVTHAWSRIVAWLGEYAPESHGALRPAASLEHIRATEEAMGLSFPQELVTWLRHNDGVASEPEGWILGGFAPYSVSGLFEVWRMKLEGQERVSHQDSMEQDGGPARQQPMVRYEARDRSTLQFRLAARYSPSHKLASEQRRVNDAERQPAGTPYTPWLPCWIPIADEMGDTLFVDMRSGHRHACLSTFVEGEVLSSGVWPGIAEMLREVAEALENGTPLKGRVVQVDDRGRLMWD